VFEWPPPKLPIQLSVVIPSSNLSIYKDLKLKTRLVGELARALAVFRVGTIAIYRDPESSKEDHLLLTKIMKYLLIPPYLRIKVQGIDKHLRFVGLLPPLSLYTHNPENRPVNIGDIRFGLVLNEFGMVDIGWSRPCRLADYSKLKRGNVVLIEVISVDPLVCRTAENPSFYAGYSVLGITNESNLLKFVNSHSIVINTSKNGVPLHSITSNHELLRKLSSTRSICLLFGNPRKDFNELVKASPRIDMTVNFIPHQGTLTVRTSEAIIASLAVLNALFESEYFRSSPA